MFDHLEILRLAHGLARHSSARQSAVAENIANVDTPDYKQRDIAPFAALYEAGPADRMRASRSGHFDADTAFTPPQPQIVQGAIETPNGNSVSLESEIVKAAELRQTHDMALSVYQSALTILRTTLARR